MLLQENPKGQANQIVWPCGHVGRRAAVCMRKWCGVQTGVSDGREPLSGPSKPAAECTGFESSFLGTTVPMCLVMNPLAGAF